MYFTELDTSLTCLSEALVFLMPFTASSRLETVNVASVSVLLLPDEESQGFPLTLAFLSRLLLEENRDLLRVETCVMDCSWGAGLFTFVLKLLGSLPVLLSPRKGTLLGAASVDEALVSIHKNTK
jgi:hypothetical protein